MQSYMCQGLCWYYGWLVRASFLERFLFHLYKRVSKKRNNGLFRFSRGYKCQGLGSTNFNKVLLFSNAQDFYLWVFLLKKWVGRWESNSLIHNFQGLGRIFLKCFHAMVLQLIVSTWENQYLSSFAERDSFFLLLKFTC